MTITTNKKMELTEITLSEGELSVTIIPEANMVVSALRKNNTDLIGQREGLQAYVEETKSFGIPFLSPWANRLATNTYQVEKTNVEFSFEGMKQDENGYPLHGLMSAIKGWTYSTNLTKNSSSLRGEFLYNENIPHYEAYPFPHKIEIEYILTKTNFTVSTYITNLSQQAIPIAFGWHPHFITNQDSIKIFGIKKEIPLTAEVLPSKEYNAKNTDPVSHMYEMEPEWHITLETPEGELKMSTHNYAYLLQWNPEGVNFVALEPMTANIDPFHNSPQLITSNTTYAATYTLEV